MLLLRRVVDRLTLGGKGTGLGLALVRQIVKLSGGRLGVKSKVNEGSTFWVELREYPDGLYAKTTRTDIRRSPWRRCQGDTWLTDCTNPRRRTRRRHESSRHNRWIIQEHTQRRHAQQHTLKHADAVIVCIA